VFHGLPQCILCSELRSERRAFSGSLESLSPGAGSGNHIPHPVRYRDERVVERGLNVSHSVWNIAFFLLLPLHAPSWHVSLLRSSPDGLTSSLFTMFMNHVTVAFHEQYMIQAQTPKRKFRDYRFLPICCFFGPLRVLALVWVL
jgi:hypothetical protein